MKIGQEKAIWEVVLLPGVQEVEAELVAKFAETWCSGASGIPRRSSSSRQQYPGEVGFCVLKEGGE
jgi:hypothetical protein